MKRLAAILSVLRSGAAPGHRGPGDSWRLPSHSFERTLQWDDESWWGSRDQLTVYLINIIYLYTSN